MFICSIQVNTAYYGSKCCCINSVLIIFLSLQKYFVQGVASVGSEGVKMNIQLKEITDDEVHIALKRAVEQVKRNLPELHIPVRITPV